MSATIQNAAPSQEQRHANREESLLRLIAESHIEDPGEWDLDDEQPVSLSITLKEVRLARRLLRDPAPPDELTEEVCQFAKYELEEGGLLESRRTNAEEDSVVEELAADIQAFVSNWIEKRAAVERQ